MITLDTELLFQSKYYELSTKRKNKSAYESIDETEAQAAEGSSAYQNTNISGLDTNEIIEALKLNQPRNKFAILSQLPHSELTSMLYMIKDKKKLVLGLKFFTKPKILQYLYNLPKEQILKMLNNIYSKEEILSFMPTKQLQAFLGNSKIKQSDLLKHIQSMPKNILTQISEAVTGKPSGNKSQEELFKEISSFKQGALVEGLRTALPYKELLSLTTKLVENNNDLMLQFPKALLMEPIERLGKESIIDNMQVLEPETIIKLLDQLPTNLLAVVGTMIEDDVLTEYLQKYHSDLLSSISG